MFEVLRAPEGHQHAGSLIWQLRLKAGGRVIATSSEGYAKRSAVLADIKRVQGLAPGAQVLEVIG